MLCCGCYGMLAAMLFTGCYACYAMRCYARLCHAMRLWLSYVMLLCHALECYAMIGPRLIMPRAVRYIMLINAAMPFYVNVVMLCSSCSL